MSNNQATTTLAVVTAASENYLLVTDSMLFLNSFWDSRIPNSVMEGKNYVKVKDVTWAIISDRASAKPDNKVGVFSIGNIFDGKLNLSLKALFDTAGQVPQLVYPQNNDLSALGFSIYSPAGAKVYTTLLDHVKAVSSPASVHSAVHNISQESGFRSGKYKHTIYKGEPSVVLVFPTNKPEQTTLVSGLDLQEAASTFSVGPEQSMIMFTNTATPSGPPSGIVSVLGPVSSDTLKIALQTISKAMSPSVKAPRVTPHRVSKQAASPDLSMSHGYSISIEDPGQ